MDLKLHKEYSRKEVHDIFSPTTPFYPQAGQWGMNGVVRISKGIDDFVFFINLDKESKYAGRQEIRADGILKWNAPAEQDIGSPLIQTLTKHTHPKNKIYLFVRTAFKREFTYLGNIKYQSHDPESMHPIEFKWKLVDWPPPKEIMVVLVQSK